MTPTYEGACCVVVAVKGGGEWAGQADVMKHVVRKPL